MAEDTENRLETNERNVVISVSEKGMEHIKQAMQESLEKNMDFFQPTHHHYTDKYITMVDTATLSPKISSAEIPKYNHAKSYDGSSSAGVVFFDKLGPISVANPAQEIPLSTGTVIMNNDGKFELKMNDVYQAKKYPAPPDGVDQEWWDAEMARADELYAGVAKKGFRTWNDKPDRDQIQNIGIGHTVSVNGVQQMSNGNPKRVPIICRSYDNFIATIQELYGPKPEQPTLIPVALLFQFELNEDHYNIDYKPERRYRDDYEDEYSGQKNYLVKERRKAGYQEIPDSGFSCILWLIENNYIPSYYSIHTDEDEIHDLMAQTLHEWMNANNFRDN